MVLKPNNISVLLIISVLIAAMLSMGTTCQNKRRFRHFNDSSLAFDSAQTNAGQYEYESESLSDNGLSDQEIEEVTRGERFNEKDEEKKELKTPNIKIPKAPVFPAGLFQVFIICLLGVVLAYIIYLIIKNRHGNSVIANSNVSTADVLDPEILSKLEINSMLEKYLHNKDYRMAVRMLYLQLLQRLFTAGHVMPSKEKTNHDFYLELQGKLYQSEFGKLTRIYEEAWYADADVNATAYGLVQARYQFFINTIR